MAKGKRDSKLTLSDAEQKISAFLRAWMFRRFEQMKRADYLNAKGQYFRNDPKRALNREGYYLFSLWQMEGMQFAKEMSGEQRNLAFMIEQLSEVFRRTRATHIQKIKLMTNTYLKEYCRAVSDTMGSPESDWMNHEELTELSHLAVFTYLESWLDGDRKNFLALERFIKCGYDGIKANDDFTKNYESRKAALNRAYDEYENMYRKEQAQKKEQSLLPHNVRYKRGNERKLSLLDIAWCDAWRQRKLELLRIFFFRENLKNRKSEHDSRQNELLRNALNCYAQFIDQIVASYPNDTGKIDQYKEYVANCCLIQRLERSYHFGLAAHMAAYASEHGYKPDAYDKVQLSAYIGVHQNEEWMLFLSNQLLDKNGARKYNHAFHPLRTLGFDTIVEQIFEVTEAEQREHLIEKELMQRAAVDNLLFMLAACFPYDRRSWTGDDFCEAAEFLKNEYRFLDKLDTWVLPELGGEKSQQTEQQKKMEGRVQKFLDYYYAYFLRLYEDDSTLTKKVIENLTKHRKGKSRQFSES